LPAAQDHEPAFLVAAGTPSPLGQLLAKERSERLERLLERLSAAQADALRLRFFGELRFQEIADTMGCSLNTAKNRVKWGLLRLADMLNNSEQPQPIDRLDRAGETPC
jgi:RNA polymerase sigma-70 factor (ECF subfamily)